ncbi:hypothetical protein [Streptacidiphilus sp. MAP5-3]|uniref:hypothetical protein n=1 Tax=unclassified Streptacidiphilus TaxID=2643834 RepID=UPI0035185CEA
MRRSTTPTRRLSGGGGLSAADVISMQRTAGNTAVTAALRSAPGSAGAGAGADVDADAHAGVHADVSVQRETEDGETTTGRLKDTLDNAAQNVAAGTAPTVGAQYVDPSVSTPASYAGGMVGPFSSVLTAGAGIVTGAMAMHHAEHELSEHAEGSAPHREAAREQSSARAEVGQGVSGLAGNVISGAGGVMNYLGYPTPVYNAMFSAGGAVALPATLVQTARYARKAAKAQTRVEALRALMSTEDDQPKQALEAAAGEVAACRELAAALTELVASKSATYQAHLAEMGRSPLDRPLGTDLGSLKEARLEVHEWSRRLDAAQEGLTQALARQQQREDVRRAMDHALAEAAEEVNQHTSGAPRQISLRMIQAYAVRKNQRGRIKKIIAATGGALGASGSVAALVTSIAVAAGTAAGAGLFVASPIGWALAGAAALVGLGLASYKAWKFFAKRWDQTAEPDAEGKPTRAVRDRLGSTLAFWKRTGPSKRQEYAAALYGMAQNSPDADPVRTREARDTIAALGLDWDELAMSDEPESAKKLIAAKLAS